MSIHLCTAFQLQVWNVITTTTKPDHQIVHLQFDQRIKTIFDQQKHFRIMPGNIKATAFNVGHNESAVVGWNQINVTFPQFTVLPEHHLLYCGTDIVSEKDEVLQMFNLPLQYQHYLPHYDVRELDMFKLTENERIKENERNQNNNLKMYDTFPLLRQLARMKTIDMSVMNYNDH